VHLVDVRLAGKVIYSEKVFVGGGRDARRQRLVGGSQ
jgi:hypothetical protein